MPPTVVFVPGAWHTTDSASLLLPELEAFGFSTKALQLPSVGTTESIIEDTSFLRVELTKLLEDGQDVILILHSYAGFPSSNATKGLGISDHKDRSKGAIVGLIFVSAFISTEGQSVEGIAGGKLPDWNQPDEEIGFANVVDPRTIFYGDVPEDLTVKAIESLKPQSLRSFRDPAGPVGYADPSFDGRRAYILTTEDTCFSIALQEYGVNGSGVSWERLSMPTSHSPFRAGLKS